MRFVSLWISIGFIIAPAYVLAQSGEELAEEDPAALREMFENQARDNARHLAKAYGMSDAEHAELEKEFLGQVDAEISLRPAFRAAALQVGKSYEAEVAKRGEDWLATPEERRQLEAPLNEVLAKEPLTIENCQKFVERKLPANRIEEGRRRLPEVQVEEARAAQDEIKAQQERDAQGAATLAVATELSRKADAELSPAGNPMPKEELVAPPAATPPTPAPHIERPVVTPPPPAVVEKPRPPVRHDPVPQRAEPAAPQTQAPAEAPRLAPAPPIDEWDRYVDSVAQKYKFSGDQKGKGQAILKDLRDRARQYRKSHAADYERLKRISDTNERTAEGRLLNAPLDELFAELKERLELLPTQEQREGSSTPKG